MKESSPLPPKVLAQRLDDESVDVSGDLFVAWVDDEIVGELGAGSGDFSFGTTTTTKTAARIASTTTLTMIGTVFLVLFPFEGGVWDICDPFLLGSPKYLVTSSFATPIRLCPILRRAVVVRGRFSQAGMPEGVCGRPKNR
jgi:hypothetical protein